MHRFITAVLFALLLAACGPEPEHQPTPDPTPDAGTEQPDAGQEEEPDPDAGEEEEEEPDRYGPYTLIVRNVSDRAVYIWAISAKKSPGGEAVSYVNGEAEELQIPPGQEIIIDEEMPSSTCQRKAETDFARRAAINVAAIHFEGDPWPSSPPLPHAGAEYVGPPNSYYSVPCARTTFTVEVDDHPEQVASLEFVVD